MTSMTGHCRCKAVTLTIPDATAMLARGVGVCHCTDCRASTGAVAGMELSSPKKDVQIKGSPKAYTNKADSGHEVTRYFCDTCGSPLYAVMSRMADFMFMNVGIFPPKTLPAPTSEHYLRNLESWEKPYPGVKANQ